MEGLIPFILHAIKGHNKHKNYRSLSEGSSRGYHLLTTPHDQGSSHRRARSEFQPPTVEFMEQRSALEFSHSRSFRSINNGTNVLSPSKMMVIDYSKQMGGSSSTLENQGNFSNLRRR